jgi:cell division septum initiation protein DivIVA
MVASTSTRTALALVVGILAGCLSLLAAGRAEAAEPPSPNPEQLWEEYPLEPPATEPPVEPAPAQEPAPAATPTPTEGGFASAWRLLLLGGVGALIVLLVSGGLIARARRPRPTATVPSRRETPDELIARARALAKEAAGCDKYLHGQRDEGIRVMSETADHNRSVASGTAPGASTYADIGDRVAGVLTAAEAAASQILDDARAGAEDILGAARQDADEVRRGAETYVADTRAAVESYASDRRREAEQAVQKQLTESEAQARATRQAAEAMAQQLEDAARQRGQALRDETRVVEERLKKVTVGLRRMTAEIEELLTTSAGNGESLTDALRPYSQRDETPVAASRPQEQ